MHRQPMRDRAQPTPHGFSPGYPGGLASQDEESGLEDVFDIVLVA
jgi:hypothetical protein